MVKELDTIKQFLEKVKFRNFPKKERKNLKMHLEKIQKMIDENRDKTEAEGVKQTIITYIDEIDKSSNQHSILDTVLNRPVTIDDLRPLTPPSRTTRRRSRSRGGRRKSLHRKK